MPPPGPRWVHTALLAGAVWVLPLVPGEPLVAPIFHPRDHLLPPPFPVLLIAPAFLMDLLRRPVPKTGWADAVEAGGAFALGLLVVQWPFAAFLLSPSADHWFFAGGGRHWPFFLQIAPAAERAFWHTPEEALSPARALLAAGLAMVSAYFGLRLGVWMKGARR